MILNGVTFIQIHNGRQYSVNTSGGTLQADRFNSAGQWVPIGESPLPDGFDDIIETSTRDPERRIRLTPGTPGMTVEWDRLLPNRTDQVSEPGGPSGPAVDQTARDAAAAAQQSASSAATNAQISILGVNRLEQIGDATVTEPAAGFFAFDLDFSSRRNFIIDSSVLAATGGNALNVRLTGPGPEGPFSIAIRKSAGDNTDIVFGQFRFVGNVPDFSQANKSFLIQGQIFDGNIIVASVGEENPAAPNPAPAQRLRLESFTENIGLALTDAWAAVTGLAAIEAGNAFPWSYNPTTGLFEATGSGDVDLGFEAENFLTPPGNNNRGHLEVRLMSFDGAAGGIFAGSTPVEIPKTKRRGGYVRLAGTSDTNHVTADAIPFQFVTGQKIQVEVRKTGENQTLETFRLYMR